MLSSGKKIKSKNDFTLNSHRSIEMQTYGGLNMSDIFEDAEDLRIIGNMTGDELIHFLLL